MGLILHLRRRRRRVGRPRQVCLGGETGMLIPGETAQPSVPIWVLLLVHDGKEKHPSLPFLSPVKSTLT